MTARLLSVSSSDWPASETKLRSFRMSETVRSAISMDLSGLSTKTLSTSPHCSSKRPRLSSESGSTRRSTRPRRSLSSLSASSSELLSCAMRSYSEPNSSLLRSRCSSLLCAALRREAKNSASNKTTITTTTMITIRAVVPTSPPHGSPALHYPPQGGFTLLPLLLIPVDDRGIGASGLRSFLALTDAGLVGVRTRASEDTVEVAVRGPRARGAAEDAEEDVEDRIG